MHARRLEPRACSRDRAVQLCTCCVHVCTAYTISVVFSLQSITASIGIPNFYLVFLMVPLNSVSSGSMKWMLLNSRIVELRFLVLLLCPLGSSQHHESRITYMFQQSFLPLSCNTSKIVCVVLIMKTAHSTARIFHVPHLLQSPHIFATFLALAPGPLPPQKGGPCF